MDVCWVLFWTDGCGYRNENDEIICLLTTKENFLKKIEFSGMDVASYMDDLIKSPTIKNLRENLFTLIIEAKHLVEMSEELYEELDRMVVVTEEKGEVGP